MFKKVVVTGFKLLWLAFLFCNHLLFTFIIGSLDTPNENRWQDGGDDWSAWSENNFSFGSYTPHQNDFEHSRNSRM